MKIRFSSSKIATILIFFGKPKSAKLIFSVWWGLNSIFIQIMNERLVDMPRLYA